MGTTIRVKQAHRTVLLKEFKSPKLSNNPDYYAIIFNSFHPSISDSEDLNFKIQKTTELLNSTISKFYSVNAPNEQLFNEIEKLGFSLLVFDNKLCAKDFLRQLFILID